MTGARKPRYGDVFAGHDSGADMAVHANVLWETYKSDLEERGLWSPTRALTLDRLVRYRVEHDHYHPIALAEGPVAEGKGNGGKFVNMLWSMVQKLADRVERLEKALAITPESVGEKSGPSKAPSMPSAASSYLERAKTH